MCVYVEYFDFDIIKQIIFLFLSIIVKINYFFCLGKYLINFSWIFIYIQIKINKLNNKNRFRNYFKL